MPAHGTIALSPDQRTALERACERHRLASVRERAAAVLLVADGQSQRDVALHGFARPKKPDTIGTWLAWFRAGGLAALEAHQHGGARRGRLRRGRGGADSRAAAPGAARD